MIGRSLNKAAKAAAKGDLKALGRILARSPAVLTDRDEEGRTLLDLACRAATCDIAIPHGRGVDAVYPDNLRAAASLGQDLSRFVGADGELTATAREGLGFYAPVFFPSWKRTLSRQEVLDEALSWAARNNQCGSIEALVELGANVNANPFRGTPLLWACYSDKVEAAACLLDRGADPSIVDAAYDATPLEWAVECGAPDSAELLRRRA